uniref:Torsin-1A-interacting protein 1/2 AAA+ activator domain-containing protein n=1 Tax=Magallana gigas TaxID=29159 RepID=K1Q486_MAGGI
MGIINGTAVKHASIGIIADTMSAVKKRTTRNSPNIREERNSEELDTSQEDSYTGDEDQKRNESPESLKTRKLSKSPTASPKESTRKRKPSKSIQEKGATPSTELQRTFTTQDKDFWKKIKVPVLRVIKEEEPEYPAVLLLVVPKGESTSQTATCLAKKYRSNLSKLYRGSGNINEAYIDAQTLSSSGSVENIKYDLDNKIKELLDNTNTELPTMVIDHIEALDPNVMLLFHGYCDGDYAPHKKALILFVLHTNLDSKEIKNLDRTVDGLLQSLWGKNLDADKIPPLIARIANNKAMIHEEKMSSLTNSGC